MAWRPDKDNQLLNKPQYQDINKEETLYLTKLFLHLLDDSDYSEDE